jgi:hypothetical protein
MSEEKPNKYNEENIDDVSMSMCDTVFLGLHSLLGYDEGIDDFRNSIIGLLEKLHKKKTMQIADITDQKDNKHT